MRFSKPLLLSLLVCNSVYAQEIKIIGTVDTHLKAPLSLHNSQPMEQHIKLLNVELTEPAIHSLKQRATIVNSKSFALKPSNSLPTKIELGMNNVPVLNQGMFGTCVTFANTAAIDAALNKGDYISQLCQLQLGLHFEQNGYTPSGWDGTWGRASLNQMEHFGIISKEQQKSQGCGGLTEYPYSEMPGEDTAMPLTQFHQLSENLVSDYNVTWSPILDFVTSTTDRVDTNKTINDIKVALNEKNRVTFGVLLLDFDLGFVGAVGTHHATFDTWVLTPEIARDIYLKPFFGGHEMIITGYDDDAVATDDQGREHKGLFTLRNSWGDKFGDKGDFYMSYDYFMVLAVEAQRIRSYNPEDSARS